MRVLQDPCFDRAFRLVYRPAATASTRGSADTDSQGLRHWPADLSNFPAALRRPVIECEAKFTTATRQPPDVVRRVLRDVPRRLVQRGLGAQGRRQARARDDRRGLHGPARRRCRSSGSCTPASRQAEARDPAHRRDAARGPLEGDARGRRTERRASSASTDADRLLRLAAAGAARARERPDVHGLRRPRRDRRLEPRPRLARPRVHVAARPAHHHATRWSPTRSSRTGATTRCATARGRTATLLDLRSRRTSRCSRATGRHDPAARRRAKLLEKLFGLNQPDPEEPAPQLKWHFTIDGPRHRVRRARHAHAPRLPLALPAAGAALREGARRSSCPTRASSPLPAGIDVLVVISQTPPVLPSIATRYIVPLRTRSRSSSTTRVAPADRARARQRDLAGRRRRLRGAAASGSPPTGRSSCSRARCTSARPAS